MVRRSCLSELSILLLGMLCQWILMYTLPKYSLHRLHSIQFRVGHLNVSFSNDNTTTSHVTGSSRSRHEEEEEKDASVGAVSHDHQENETTTTISMMKSNLTSTNGSVAPTLTFQTTIATSNGTRWSRMGLPLPHESSLSNDAFTEEENHPFSSCGRLSINGTDPAVCGQSKCFVNVQNDPTIGYIVMVRKASHIFRKSLEAYQRAMDMHDKHGIQHLYLEPPHIVDQLLPCIRSQLVNHQRLVTPNANIPPVNFSVPNSGDTSIIIQKCRRAPQPHLLVGIGGPKGKHARTLLEPFVRTHVTNATRFVNQLGLERIRTISMLHDEPCLVSDFQVLLDSSGTMFHLDFDRCPSLTISPSALEKSIRKFNAVMDILVDVALHGNTTITTNSTPATTTQL